jgi:hypothetical protein
MACARGYPRLPGTDLAKSDKRQSAAWRARSTLGCRRVVIMDLTVRSRGDDSRPGGPATYARPAPTRRPFSVVGKQPGLPKRSRSGGGARSPGPYQRQRPVPAAEDSLVEDRLIQWAG